MSEQTNAVLTLQKELDLIQDANLKGFFYNAIAVAPESFHEDQELLQQVKKAFHILRGMLEQRRVEGAVRDALLGTVLLCDLLSNEYTGDAHPLHTVAVRHYLTQRQVERDIQQGLWENIMRAVESHEGNKGASPILEAKPGTAEYEVANAFAVARLPYLVYIDEEVTKDGQESDDEKES